MFNSTSNPESDTAILLDLDLTSVLVAIITLIIVGIVVVVTLIVIVWYLKQRHVGDNQGAARSENCSRVCERCQRASKFSLAHRARATNCVHSTNSLDQISPDFAREHSSVNAFDSVPPVISLRQTEVHPPRSNFARSPLNALQTSNITPTPIRPQAENDMEVNSTETVDHDLPADVSISTSLVQSYASVCDDFLRRCLREFDQDSPVKLTPENVREISNLGQGQFGEVVLAEAIGLNRRKLSHFHKNRIHHRRSTSMEMLTLVAVKKLKPGADKGIQRAFEKEIKVMSQLKHENIVRLLGVCTVGDMFLVMEYMENGDLNQFLKKKESVPQDLPDNEIQLLQDSVKHISLQTLVSMSFQIASGMKYLASLRFIHRDLASRNCLVGTNNIIKIADFGLSRSLYSSRYYKVKGCAILPLRWMATECFYGKFSEKSDVWAFGVTMWEIFMLCRQVPYENLSNPELIRDAIKGPDRQILSRPSVCPSDLYKDVMLPCWTFDPMYRADFEEIHGALKHYYGHSSLV